jgi:hypothetical protein
MRARAPLAGLVATSSLVTAGPASAKASIAEATSPARGSMPGSGSSLRTRRAYRSPGIDVVGGLDDIRPDSVEGLGLTPADLGPRYLVTYRFELSDDHIRQDLYPYARVGR